MYKIWSVNISRFLFAYKRLNSCSYLLKLKAHVHLSLNTKVIKKTLLTSCMGNVFHLFLITICADEQVESASLEIGFIVWNIFYLEKSFSTEIEVLEFHSRRLWLQKTTHLLKYIAEINSISLLWLGCMGIYV